MPSSSSASGAVHMRKIPYIQFSPSVSSTIISISGFVPLAKANTVSISDILPPVLILVAIDRLRQESQFDLLVLVGLDGRKPSCDFLHLSAADRFGVPGEGRF